MLGVIGTSWWYTLKNTHNSIPSLLKERIWRTWPLTECSQILTVESNGAKVGGWFKWDWCSIWPIQGLVFNVEVIDIGPADYIWYSKLTFAFFWAVQFFQYSKVKPKTSKQVIPFEIVQIVWLHRLFCLYSLSNVSVWLQPHRSLHPELYQSEVRIYNLTMQTNIGVHFLEKHRIRYSFDNN